MSLIQIIMSPELIHALGWTLVHSLWQGFIVFVIASLLLWVLRKHSPHLKYTVLCLSMAVILLSSVITFLVLSDSFQSTQENVPSVNAYPMALIVYPGSQGTGSGLVFYVRSYLSHLNSFVEMNGNYLVLFWFIGFMFFMIRYLGGLSYIHQLKKKGTHPIPEYWQQKAMNLAGKSGISKGLKILESIYIKIPVTIGHFKPVILVPIGMIASLPPEQVEAILVHEMAHIVRKDYLVNLLQSMMEALFFYHPVVWWISQKIRSERENICDDIAVKRTRDPLTYIKALTTMEELNSHVPVLANAFAGDKKHLLNRIRRMISPEGNRFRPVGGMVSALVLVFLAFVFGAGTNLDASQTGLPLSNNVTAISPDAMNSLAFHNPSPGHPSLYSADVIKADTTVTSSQEKRLAEEISQKPDTTSEAEQEALEKLHEAMAQREEAMKAYQEAMEEYQDLIKDMQKEKLFQNFNWMYLDSLDTAMVFSYPDIGSFYKFSPKDFKNVPMPEFFNFNLPDSGKYSYSYKYSYPHSYFYKYSWPDHVEIFKDDSCPGGIIETPDKDFRWKMDRDKELKWIEQNKKKGSRGIDRRIIVSPPDVTIHTSPDKDRVIVANRKSPERIVRQELIDDGLIVPGKDYIIELSPNEMYINGEKQSRDVLKKYKKIYEGVSGHPIDVTVKMIF